MKPVSEYVVWSLVLCLNPFKRNSALTRLCERAELAHFASYVRDKLGKTRKKRAEGHSSSAWCATWLQLILEALGNGALAPLFMLSGTNRGNRCSAEGQGEDII